VSKREAREQREWQRRHKGTKRRTPSFLRDLLKAQKKTPTPPTLDGIGDASGEKPKGKGIEGRDSRE
jgi:hypothetical protein